MYTYIITQWANEDLHSPESCNRNSYLWVLHAVLLINGVRVSMMGGGLGLGL